MTGAKPGSGFLFFFHPSPSSSSYLSTLFLLSLSPLSFSIPLSLSRSLSSFYWSHRHSNKHTVPRPGNFWIPDSYSDSSPRGPVGHLNPALCVCVIMGLRYNLTIRISTAAPPAFWLSYVLSDSDRHLHRHHLSSPAFFIHFCSPASLVPLSVSFPSPSHLSSRSILSCPPLIHPSFHPFHLRTHHPSLFPLLPPPDLSARLPHSAFTFPLLASFAFSSFTLLPLFLLSVFLSSPPPPLISRSSKSLA